ncbi:MAG TPA: glycosyltransferase family 2 protein [Patescibacteria group bacterium]|nr:glycosyltransferase family 2 protein [Patescibacteria group bacterium]
MAKISIILVGTNEEKFIENCLDNLKKIKESEFEDLEVIVKDQGSTDNSVRIISENYPWVRLIKGDNEGLSRAYNIAYKQSTGKYILFLGLDAIPEPNTLTGLFNYFEEDSNRQVGAATCKLVLKDGSLDMDAHRGFPTPWNSICRLFGLGRIFPNDPFFNQYFLLGRNMEQPHEIDLCISHFMFTRRETLENISGFDELFFLYGEDVDTCYRIKQAGWKIMYLPQWKSLHWKGGSVGIRNTTRNIVKKPLKHRLKMQKLSTQAMGLFIKKHYMKKYPLPLVFLMLLTTYLLGVFRVVGESLR